MPDKDSFTFAISLSVLDHLGRNLYRSFATVLGEAISNSWDADAKNVRIYVDRKKNSFYIKDDGVGMTSDDFQNKFLKIGYTKRKNGKNKSPGKRPYIGRKGIGKLALLSCADKITIISKVHNEEYVGGVIDNSKLDKAITDDSTPQEYLLETPDLNKFKKLTRGHKNGTIILFEGTKDGIKNSLDFLRRIIALYFRFSLLDSSFNIFLNDKKITLNDLDFLAEKTEFLWCINRLNDPYINKHLKKLKEPKKSITMKGEVKGFIASVSLPRDLKITTTDEREGVDLFVNGRLREKDILKHIPTARIAESYFYGQIHFDALDDDKKDRFATSREGIIADDPEYKEFLENLRKVILEIITDWDKLRIKHREDGDSENENISKKERKSLELYNAVSNEYVPVELGKEKKEKIDEWIVNLSKDASYNFASYAECFISENLIRNHIHEKQIALSDEAKKEITNRKNSEAQHKNSGNISIKIRKTPVDSSYLSMDHLANLVDKTDSSKASLSRDAKEYKPIRDALMHTALLTDDAKTKLTTVYSNIKGRVKKLLSN